MPDILTADSGSSGTSSWADSATVQSAGNVFIYKPGAVASGNVYTDFNTMWTEVAKGNSDGQTIVFDNTGQAGASVTIPAKTGGGSYGSVAGQIWLGVGDRPGLDFEEGAQFDEFPVVLENIEFDSAAGRTTTAVFTIDLAQTSAHFLREVRMNGSDIEFIQINKTSVTQFHCWGTNCRLRNSGYESFNVLSTGTVRFRLYDYAELDDDAVRGAAGCNIAVSAHYASGADTSLGRTQTNVAGTFAFTPVSAFNFRGGGTLTTTGAPHALTTGPDIYLFDTTAGAFEVDLPTTASGGGEVILKNAGTSVTALTIDGNGSNVENPGSPGAYAASVTSIAAGAFLHYVKDSTNNLWRLCS